MSRHKLIKNMDLDDELDDFDGGEDYDYDGEDAGTEGRREQACSQNSIANTNALCRTG